MLLYTWFRMFFFGLGSVASLKAFFFPPLALGSLSALSFPLLLPRAVKRSHYGVSLCCTLHYQSFGTHSIFVHRFTRYTSAFGAFSFFVLFFVLFRFASPFLRKNKKPRPV